MSTANINGQNPDNNIEIWLADIRTENITKISGDVVFFLFSDPNPSINTDGTRIVFSNDLEIYLFDTTTGVITQITDTPMDSSGDPSINADGTRIAFRSSANINGDNPEGNFEIYLFDTTTGIFAQITSEPSGESVDPSINADGTRIAFRSSANINGGNPEGNSEIYLFDTLTGIFTQITDEPGPRGSSFPSINADGTRIAFHSGANINGGNPDGFFDIYLFDSTTGIITQITNDPGTGDSNRPSINADGTRIAFRSEVNINGGNPDGPSQIYLARCFDPRTFRNIPTLSEWGLIAMAGVLGITGLLVMRRRHKVSV